MNDLPRAMKHGAIWGVLGCAVFLGVQAWLAQRQQPQLTLADGAVVLQRAADGHFHWPGTVNGVAVEFLVDTGATRSALPQALAAQAGLRAEGPATSVTAGGTVAGHVARADIALRGGVAVQQLPVTVLPALAAPLLGMDVLGHLRFSQADGRLRIEAGDPR